MNLFMTFHANRLTGTFTDRAASERYPGPRGLECADKRIIEYGPAQWEDAAAHKPEPGKEVMLFRVYTPPLIPKTQTGFRSYGVWDGKHWNDRLFGCIVDDVKFYHELPPLPEGETAGE